LPQVKVNGREVVEGAGVLGALGAELLLGNAESVLHQFRGLDGLTALDEADGLLQDGGLGLLAHAASPVCPLAGWQSPLSEFSRNRGYPPLSVAASPACTPTAYFVRGSSLGAAHEVSGRASI